MKPPRYIIVSQQDEGSADLPQAGEWQSTWDEYRSAIYRCDDAGKPVEYIGSDGGEPEDNTLGRDWAWVLDALNAEALR